MDRYAAQPQFRLPTLEPWMKQLLGLLFGMYVLELVLRNTGMPVGQLEWHAFESGFAIYQPVSRYLVQGRSAVFSVMIGLLVLYFLLPGLLQMFSRQQLTQAVLSSAVGGTVLPMLLDAVWLSGGAVMGWSVLVLTLVVLFGLANPSGTIYAFFFIPISGTLILYGSLAISLAGFILSPTLAQAEPVGVWLGTVGWWFFMGPGRRRRDLKKKAEKIEKELRRFQVLEGGLSDTPQGDQDEWIH